MTKEEFKKLKVGSIITNKSNTLDCNGNPVCVGYDYIVTEIKDSVVYANLVLGPIAGEGISQKPYVLTLDNIEQCIDLHVKNQVQYNVVLYLNNDGIKVIGDETKQIHIEKIENEIIDDNDINNVFPMCLVDHYEIYHALFDDAKPDDLCKISDSDKNEIYVGKIVKVYKDYFTASPIFDLRKNIYDYNIPVKFHLDGHGMTATKGKDGKWMATKLSESELNQYNEFVQADAMYENVLTLLGVDLDMYKNSYDVCEPERPSYIGLNTLDKIKQIIDQVQNEHNS